MPKPTFFNLDDDKRGRVFDAAVREFSAVSFTEASVNRIVKDAGISKGSFYQYFEDKTDLYLHMAEIISEQKAAVFTRVREEQPDADVFEVILLSSARVATAADLGAPDYAEAGVRVDADESDAAVALRKASSAKFVELVERDKARGLIKPTVDSELLINMISTFSINEFYRSRGDRHAYLENLRAAINLIKEGVATARADHAPERRNVQ